MRNVLDVCLSDDFVHFTYLRDSPSEYHYTHHCYDAKKKPYHNAHEVGEASHYFLRYSRDAFIAATSDAMRPIDFAVSLFVSSWSE